MSAGAPGASGSARRAVVIGGDGRAHALATVLRRSAQVVVTPGNPGIEGSVSTDPMELDADLFVISPEVPLVDGLADRLRAQGKRVYGPGADGAQLEGSKAFMKELVAAAGVPTARYGAFTDAAEAIAYLGTLPPPYVVKTDGLAAGKGVLVTNDRAAAEADVRDKLSGTSFGEAGRVVVIEEGMVGPELSILAVCDGHRAVALAPAQDFKRALDGDLGPNTGGMGSYSPVPFATDELVADVLARFVEPTLAELRRRGIDYRGTLYAGLMITAEGPKLIEYNVRFGDPEAQVVLTRLTSDLFDLLAEAADGALASTPTFGDDAAVLVVAASPGYPEAPQTGGRIAGVEAARATGADVFCAGVKADDSGNLVTGGGRVLNVVGYGPTIAEARDRAYRALAEIEFDGGVNSRTDIAAQAAHDEATAHAAAES